jgi:hypothetical protein
MGLRGEFQKKIDKKHQEIEELETKIREARIYVQALEDMMRLLPREELNGQPESTLKPGTAIGKARDAIKAAGRPLHITEILVAIGRPTDKNNRAAIGGSIAAYVRRGEVFTRPAPNTFGLVDADVMGATELSANLSRVVGVAGGLAGNQPPPDFGKD